MNTKLIYKEIGLIDDDLIEEAAKMTYITPRSKQQTKWIAIAASIVIVIGLGVITSYHYKNNLNTNVPKAIIESIPAAKKIDNQNIANDNSDFNGFIITAYTMDINTNEYLSENYTNETTATIMEPNVKILLARYNPLMSSVPGLPFTFDITNQSTEIDEITVSVDRGKLLTWEKQTDGASVKDRGRKYICSTGDTMYWSSLDEKENSIISNATITVSAIKDDKEIGYQTINIIFDGVDYYAVINKFKNT